MHVWSVLVVGLAPVFVAAVAGAAIAPEAASRLWYDRPAKEWVEALPLGNGRLGAMVFGGIERERMQINEGTFWSGGPYDPAHDGTAADLAEARRLILAGRYPEAERIVSQKLLGRPAGQMSYQPIGDLIIETPGAEPVSEYRRELDLDTAVATTAYMSGGIRFVRQAFCSVPDQVLVVRLRADRRGSVSVKAGIATPQKGSVTADGDDALLLRGEGPAYRGVAGALRFACRVVARAEGGSVRVEDDKLVVDQADAVLLILDARTSYVNWHDVSGDPVQSVRASTIRAIAKSGSNHKGLDASHLKAHQALFRRVSLDLGTSAAAARPTNERLRAFAAGADDPELAPLYYQFGRYLLISCSRPGGQPATLQGLWNESTTPPWDSKYTININTEMNYWPSESANLSECGEPLVQMLREMAVSGARTARRLFGARGWVCFHNTDLWRATAPIDGPWAYTPTCGAWLATQLWERWLYSGDRKRLEEAYPVLKGAAEFFLDTLIEEPGSGKLVTCPAASPENRHPKGAYVCAGPAMDNQILRDLFGYVIEASRLLKRDPDLRAQLAAARDRLPTDRIGKAGQLQEWLEDWDMEAPERHHRHVSHLYALFPSAQITPRRTPELAAAARQSLEMRGDQATGWSLGWKLNLWARLQDGERAYKLLKMLLDPSRTYPNLFDAHPPFQIDGNFGGVSGVNEMLLQSHSGEIELLPALPKAWPAGTAKGLRARGAVEVDITWSAGRLTQATLKALRSGKHVVRYGALTRNLDLKRGVTVRVGPDLATIGSG